MTATEKVAWGAWLLLFLLSLATSAYQLSKNRGHPVRARGWLALTAACALWVLAGVLVFAGSPHAITVERVGTLVALLGVYFLWSASRTI